MFLRVDHTASVRSDMAVLDPTVGRYLEDHAPSLTGFCKSLDELLLIYFLLRNIFQYFN